MTVLVAMQEIVAAVFSPAEQSDVFHRRRNDKRDKLSESLGKY